MPTVCIQCALEAFVADKDMRAEAVFDETPQQHQARVHPDLVATRARRRELERRFAEKMGGTMVYPEEN